MHAGSGSLYFFSDCFSDYFSGCFSDCFPDCFSDYFSDGVSECVPRFVLACALLLMVSIGDAYAQDNVKVSIGDAYAQDNVKAIIGDVYAQDNVKAINGDVYAQDNVKAIILSPRIGVTLDAETCRHYRFFVNFSTLHDAVFLKIGSSVYAARIRYLDSSLALRDSLIQFSLTIIRTYGERINHFDEISAGKYHIGTDPAEITEVPYDIPLRLGATDVLDYSPPKRDSAAEAQASRAYRRSRPAYDVLPFANDPDRTEELIYPIVGLGAGIMNYSPEYSGVQSAFTAIENDYRAKGNTIPKQGPDFDDRVIRFVSFMVRFSPAISLEVNAGNSLEKTITMVNGTLVYSYPVERQQRLMVSAGAGVVHLVIDAHRRYDVPLPSMGQYYALDEIAVTGAVSGILLRGAVTARLVPILAIEAFGLYMGMQKFSFSSELFQNAHVHLSGFSAGAAVHILFN
jgi:hypothetical protein